ARVHLEADDELQNAAVALEHIQKAYELGGDKDQAVLETLAKALGANGQAEHGIRYLERLHAMAATDDARVSIAARINSYRTQFTLGTSWEFSNSYGDVIFESDDIDAIEKAIVNGSIPQDAQCRKNKTGEWQSLEEGLVAEFPHVAALFKKPKGGAASSTVAMGGFVGLVVGVVAGLFVPGLKDSPPFIAGAAVAATALGALIGVAAGAGGKKK
ncbi:unnamed protein product, partial [marine sediment metagenome]